MPHWMDKVVVLLTANTSDLRELATIAGGNPRTFYRGINPEDLEFTEHDDIKGMEFGEIAESAIAHAATISALARRGISISTKTMNSRGSVGRISFSYDITYPRFARAAVDFSIVNKYFSEIAERAAISSTPTSDSRNDFDQDWVYEQHFTLYQPADSAVTVTVDFYGYTGGAHGYSATRCILVDVNRGKIINRNHVFLNNSKSLEYLIGATTADLKLQFIEKPGFNEALEPDNLRKLLDRDERYCWQADKLVLIFNAYEVGPYAAGQYTVEIQYKDLRTLLPSDWGI